MKFGHRLVLLLSTLILFSATSLTQVTFNRVPLFGKNSRGFFVDMAQDQKGYMWLAGISLYRYDGYHLITYKNNPQNSNSLAPSRLESICIDRKGIVWIGTFGSGLDRFDPAKNEFTHYPHNPNDPHSISNNIVTAITEDKEGNIWVGTHGGLNKLDQKSGKFTRYIRINNDNTSLSNNQVRVIYEDRKGTLWIGCGSPYGQETPPGEGGLNRMDKAKGTFTRFEHDSSNAATLNDNKVRALCEDSRGNFWVGTFGDGLHLMDRSKGTFTRLLSSPKKPNKLSAPVSNGRTAGVNFIKEDATGSIWIGSYFGGLNRYEPSTGKVTHFESDGNEFKSLQENSVWGATLSRDGMLWITTQTNVYRVDPEVRQLQHMRIGGRYATFTRKPPGCCGLPLIPGLFTRIKTRVL